MILQNDIANEHSPITIVAAITSKFDDKLYPTEVEISSGEGGLKQDSVVLPNQIRSIDCRRLSKKLGKVKDSTIKKVDLSVKISLGLIDI